MGSMKLAFNILAELKFQKNTFSSVFLLSDGKDEYADVRIRNLFKEGKY